MQDLLRGGRLKGPRPPEVAAYTSSIQQDERIFQADIEVDLAHVVMLTRRGIIPVKDGARILQALKRVESEGYQALNPNPSLDDVHVAIESRLTELLTVEVAGKMHTGRSRNDEVATCLRLRLRADLSEIMARLLDLAGALLSVAEQNVDTVMPGYTHTQHAQPVTLAHHLLAHLDALTRDFARLQGAYSRVNHSPLGAAALAGTGFPIDREMTASLLGFTGLVENSMDAVATRDFILETLAALSILSVNLSRFAEELVLWSSSEFGFVELPDAYTSTSSIMPQKKNPDVMELTRAKSGRVTGDLVAALMTVKALPLTYNMDLQDVTPRLWDGLDAVKETLPIVTGAVKAMRINRELMAARVREDFSTVTELADTIFRETGLPFRTAHRIVGALVTDAIQAGKKPLELTAKDLEIASVKTTGKPLGLNDSIIRQSLDPLRCIEVRKSKGGPSPQEVTRMLTERRRLVKRWKEDLTAMLRKVADAKLSLEKEVAAVIREAG
ncbi:MAG: argininosuccinate lyase [Candidatus Bathyarchaeia archaeon]